MFSLWEYLDKKHLVVKRGKNEYYKDIWSYDDIFSALAHSDFLNWNTVWKVGGEVWNRCQYCSLPALLGNDDIVPSSKMMSMSKLAWWETTEEDLLQNRRAMHRGWIPKAIWIDHHHSLWNQYQDPDSAMVGQCKCYGLKNIRNRLLVLDSFWIN